MGKMSFIRKNMTEENSQYRTEQLLCATILREFYTSVKTEYKITNLLHDELDVKQCQPDVVIENKNIAIRLNGPIHEKGKRPMKDEDQKIVLQANGWKVIDLTPHNIPELWDQRKYTYEEAKNKLLGIIHAKM